MATVYLRDKQKLRGIRWMLLAVTAISMLTMFVLRMIGSFFEDSVPVYLESLITGLLAYVVPIAIYAKLDGITAQTAAERFCLKKCSRYMIVLALIMGVCFQFVMIAVNLPFNMIFNSAESYTPGSAAELCAAMFVIGIIPAIFEEFLFRGIVLGSMSELNSRAAVIFSTVMFALMHGDLYSLAGYILMGVVLASVVNRSESLYAAMVFHFGNNMAALLLGYFNSELIYEPTATIKLFAAGIVGFATVFGIFVSVTKKRPKNNKIKASVLLGQSFVSIPVLLCIAITAAAEILIRIL